VRKFYEQNPDRFKGPARVKVSHVVLSDSTEATRVLAQLKGGVDFAKLAKGKSIDKSSAEKGGDLGILIQGTALPPSIGGSPEIEKALFTLKSGGLSDVIKTSAGFQIIKIDERFDPQLQPFESVKKRIEDGLLGERVGKMRSELLQEIKKKYPVEYLIEDSSIAITKNVSPPEVATTPEELFQAAMDSKDGRQRIGIYEDLLKKFPESKYASQAQFMIGFIYSEELKDYARAEEAFKVVMDKFRDSELVDSARWMIKNMRDESKKIGTVEDVKRKARESKQ
jgi:parvulin-like peptidyl-prolyl isomerase